MSLDETVSWWEALYEKLTGRPHPAKAPPPEPKCTHNVMAAVGGYEGGDHVHCLDCKTDLTTGEKL